MVNIDKYLDNQRAPYSFFRLAATKDEVKSSLFQSMNIFYCLHVYGIASNGEQGALPEIISTLLDKAIDLDISVTKMRKQFIETKNKDKITLFDNLMSVYIEKWENIEAIEERHKLRKAVKHISAKPERANIMVL